MFTSITTPTMRDASGTITIVDYCSETYVRTSASMKVTFTTDSWRDDNFREPACTEAATLTLAARRGMHPTPAFSAVLSMSTVSLQRILVGSRCRISGPATTTFWVPVKGRLTEYVPPHRHFAASFF